VNIVEHENGDYGIDYESYRLQMIFHDHSLGLPPFVNGTLPMHTACGSALTPALNVDGLNLIKAQAAKARGLSAPPLPLARADEMIE